MATDAVVRVGIADLERRLGRDRSTINRWIKGGRFPGGHFLGSLRAWYLGEVEEWERSEMGRPRSERRFNLPRATAQAALAALTEAHSAAVEAGDADRARALVATITSTAAALAAAPVEKHRTARRPRRRVKAPTRRAAQ